MLKKHKFYCVLMSLILSGHAYSWQSHQQTAVTEDTAKGDDVEPSMDASDQLEVAHSLENLTNGESAEWVNPVSNYRYQVKPLKTYHYNRSPCRDYIITVTVEDQPIRVLGQACRQADGSWQVIKSQTIDNQ